MADTPEEHAEAMHLEALRAVGGMATAAKIVADTVLFVLVMRGLTTPDMARSLIDEALLNFERKSGGPGRDPGLHRHVLGPLEATMSQLGILKDELAKARSLAGAARSEGG